MLSITLCEWTRLDGRQYQSLQVSARTESTMGFPLIANKILRTGYNSFFRARLSFIPGVVLSDGVIIKGMPLIDTAGGGRIYIEKGVTLNSRNRGYHINMHSPVKLMADRKGAIIRIGAETRLHGTCIHAYQSVSIGEKCLVAANTQIIDCNGHDLSFEDVEKRVHSTGSANPVVLEDCVWIGANVIILSGVHIGRGSVIGAGSVVGEDIPPFVVASGNPAKVIKRIAPSDSDLIRLHSSSY